MSKQFVVGAKYKFSALCLAEISGAMGLHFKGERGDFIVHEVTADGSAFTDDVTADITKDRCMIPVEALIGGAIELVIEEADPSSGG